MRKGGLSCGGASVLIAILAGPSLLAGQKEMVMGGENTSAPEQLDPSTPQMLRAGPIHLKLEDGQLRYLRVGDKEIVRRIYFGVRDGNWNTAPPHYTKYAVYKSDDHFTVHLAANCKLAKVDYTWHGVITGSADGKITFEASGIANDDFSSNRLSLCVLFGVPSLAGTQFETDGKTPSAVFPPLVSPTLVGTQFHSLHYTTGDGLTVTASVTGGPIFDMEDQRNWGDSSWKAYAPLTYAYPRVDKGETHSEVVTISVSGNAAADPSPQDPTRMEMGQPVEGAHLPTLGTADPRLPDFTEFSFNRQKFADRQQIEWSYTPNIHLLDDDTVMENLPTIEYQAKTVRSLYPSAVLKVGPLHLPAEKDASPLAGAWVTGLFKYLALGGVREAAFGPGLAEKQSAVLDSIRPYLGGQLLGLKTEPADARHFVAFAAKNDQAKALFIINRTARSWHAEVQNLPAKVGLLRPSAGASEQPTDTESGVLRLELTPYEVVRVTLRK